MDTRERVDIGGGHCIVFLAARDEDDDEGDDTQIGLIDFHLKPDGTPCGGGSIRFDLPQNEHVPEHAKWQVVSREPLTLSPSLLCLICGDHGWIREGAWVNA